MKSCGKGRTLTTSKYLLHEVRLNLTEYLITFILNLKQRLIEAQEKGVFHVAVDIEEALRMRGEQAVA